MIRSIGKVQVTATIEGHALNGVYRRIQRRSTVTFVAETTACYCADLSRRRIDTTDSVTRRLGNIHISDRVNC